MAGWLGCGIDGDDVRYHDDTTMLLLRIEMEVSTRRFVLVVLFRMRGVKVSKVKFDNHVGKDSETWIC
jgi:hypothetical protein